MVEFVLPLYLQSKVFLALVESKTSEHAIRRQAMKSATDNAEDLLSTLTRFFNKARQQSITREIADIVGGAEALRRT
jgi:F-type H+-transporting ATPase subunit gamma